MIRGALAGNGGEMAVTKEQLATDNACSATSNPTSSTTKSSTQKQTRRRPARKSGAERLRCAADRRVGQNSKKLADLLTAKALAGELAYAKVLVGLADGKTPEPVKNPRLLSLMMQLETEPEWVDPEEPKADSGQCAGNSE
jgi:hypothetical protein